MYISIYDINRWFNNYDKWVHQAERAERLGLAWEQEDAILKATYHSVNELDLKAEEMRKLYKEEKAKYLQQLKQKAVQNDSL